MVRRTGSRSVSTYEDRPMTLAPHRSGRADLKRVYSIFETLDVPPTLPPEEQVATIRAFTDALGSFGGELALQQIEVKAVVASGVACEWIVPVGADPRRRIIHIHGGGWVAGSFESHRGLAAKLAIEAATPVLLVDYRRAPEHGYPAASDDCMEVFDWAQVNGPQGPSVAKEVMLSGDSSGASLIAGILHDLGDRTPPARIALLTPYLDTSGSAYEARYDPLINDELNRRVLPIYTQGAIAGNDPIICATSASSATLDRYPPTLIQVSGDEFFLDAARRFADLLIDHDRRCVLSVWPHMPHGWHCFVDDLPEASAALREAGRFLAA